MRKNIVLIILMFFCFSPLAYSAWRKQCLDICFSTGHDCNYCNYQCYTEKVYPHAEPDYSEYTVCPRALQSYYRENITLY